MIPSRCALLPAAAALVLAIAAPADAGPNPCNPCNPCAKEAANPCNPCGGEAANPCNPCAKAPEVALNPCHAKHGTVFHVTDPMKRNTVTFTSRAPLEDIVGTTNAIHGYLAFDPGNPARGVRGRLVVPVASLDTGIPMRDEHLRSAQWLDAADHPHITFTVEETNVIRLVKQGDGFRTWDITVSGPLTVHGVTRNTSIEGRIVYLEESDRTREKRPGNLLATRATFEVPLAAHDVSGEGVIGSKVEKSIQVEVSLFASDAAPEAAANPCNPCNPCGGKAANPCNPCAK